MESESGFLDWLIKSKGLSPRSAKDVISRVRRASKWAALSSDAAYVIYLLEKNPDFLRLSSSVRSQIKKALKYYEEFQRSLKSDALGKDSWAKEG